METEKCIIPAPLLELWMRSIQPPHESPSGRTGLPQPPEPSSTSPPERAQFAEALGFNFEDFQSGVGSQSVGVPIEKIRIQHNINEMPPDIHMDGLGTNLRNFGLALESNGVGGTNGNLMATPANSGDEVRSFTSSGSGRDFQSHNSEVHSGRSNKKMHFSHSGGSLDPIADDKKHNMHSIPLVHKSCKGKLNGPQMLDYYLIDN